MPRGNDERVRGWTPTARAAALLAASCGVALVASAAAMAGDFDVVISEIHYHPFGEGDPDFEFVELHNAGGTAVDIAGWRFTEGIDFTFPPGSALAPDERLAVSPKLPALRSLVPGVNAVGNSTGRLENDGEILALVNARGRLVARVHYGDSGGWSTLPDGKGASLELLGARLPHSDIDRSQVWAPSRRFGGTPGAPNDRSADEYPYTGRDPPPLVRLNEVQPAVSAADKGFVELWNGGAASAEVGGFRIVAPGGQTHTVAAGTRIAPGGFLVLRGDALGFLPSAEPGVIALLAADGATLADALSRPLTPGGHSYGRFPDGAGDGAVIPPSPGGTNLHAPDERVIIHEILFAPRYEPPGGACDEDCSDRHQWLELHNRSGFEVELGGWSLDGGIQYSFPAGTEIAANGYLVIAARRAVFEQDYPGVPVAPGEWRGALGRREDRVTLRDALGNVADRVRYGNGSPFNDIDEDGRDDGTFHGSDWPREVSDSGRSIELASPYLENEAGRSWRLGPLRGTPGAPNAAFEAEPAPVVWDVSHSPAVPTSREPVTVTCRAHAAEGISRVELLWRIDGAAAPSAVAMKDDGLSGDGGPLDMTFAAAVPPQAHASIVAFQVSVTSLTGKQETYPLRLPNVTRQAMYLYEVDDDPPLPNGSVNYRIILTRSHRDELQSRPLQSDVLLPGTFIGDGEVHHLAGVRYRGENSRNLARKAYRVEFPPQDRFQGTENLNLNASNRVGGIEQTSFRDYLTAELFRRMGLPHVQEWPVNLHFQGGVDGDRQGRSNVDPFYLRKEHCNRDFLERYFGGASGHGNLYRALDPGGGSGNLSYLGPDPGDYRRFYEKRSNRDEDDYSDLIELCQTLDPDETPDAQYVDAVLGLVDVEQWGRFFAIQDWATNIDGGIQTNNGEDYLIYHVPIDSPRPDAGLWQLIPWDMEETFSDSGAAFFITSVQSARRFLRHPEFAPYYLKGLREVREELATRPEMAQDLALARRLYSPDDAQAVTQALETYVTRRNALVADSIVAGIEAAAESQATPGTKLIQEGDAWRYLRGTREPSASPLEWTEPGFADGSWEQGPSGFGYGDNDDATVLDDMQQARFEPGYLSVYIRRRFDIADLEAMSSLTLVVDYDDAFIAYLNGAEIARSPNLAGAGAIGEPLPFDTELGNGTNHEASRGGNNASPPEIFVVADFRTLLRPGANVLSLHGLNSTRDSSDFSLIPELIFEGAKASGGAGWGSEIFASVPAAKLMGLADPTEARSLKLNGVLAAIASRPPAGGAPYALAWTASVPIASGPNRVRIEAFSGPGGSGRLVGAREVTIHGLERGFTSVGAVAGDATWTAAGGPYLAAGGVSVPAGARLRIGPGATVLLGPSATLNVEGLLEIEGDVAAPVRLAPAALGGRFNVALARTGTGPNDPFHLLRHVVVENGGRAGAAAVSATQAKLLVEDSRFSGTLGAAIEGTSAVLDVRDSVLERVRDGIAATDSIVTVSGTTITGVTGDRDAIRLRGTATARSRIEDCLILDCDDDGIDLGNASVDVARNLLRNIADRACLAAGDGALGPVLLEGNIIDGAGVGIKLRGGTTPGDGHHNTILGCGVGLLGATTSPAVSDFHSNIIWWCAESVVLEPEFLLSLTQSDVGGDGVWPGTGNIALDPRFVDPGRGDFTLAPGSPCAGTGKDGTDMGATGAGASEPGGIFIRGDVTREGGVNITDAVAALEYLFRGGAQPACEDAADVDDSGEINLTDVIVLLNHLFRGAAPPPVPYPEAGRDETADGLGCER